MSSNPFTYNFAALLTPLGRVIPLTIDGPVRTPLGVPSEVWQSAQVAAQRHLDPEESLVALIELNSSWALPRWGMVKVRDGIPTSDLYWRKSLNHQLLTAKENAAVNTWLKMASLISPDS